MNCLEFCRLFQADPLHLSPEAKTHWETCPDCQRFAHAQHALNQAVSDHVHHTPIPEGLADRIILQNRIRHRVAWRSWSIAAGVLLGLAVSLLLPRLQQDDALARAALAHVQEEPHTLSARQHVSRQALSDALASVGAELRGDIGQVTYLGNCPMPGGEGKHLVVSSAYGRYSLLLIPTTSTTRKQREQGIHAAISKPAAKGSYAIVASATPDLAKIEQLVALNIVWRHSAP